MYDLIRAAKIFCISYVAIILIDLIWIGFLAKDFYQRHLAPLMRTAHGNFDPHWPAALITWFLMVLGVQLFVLPHVAGGSIAHAFFKGSLFGLVLYGVYDFTNFATLANWSTAMVIVDIAWGMVLNGIVAIIIQQLDNWLR